MSNQFLRDCQMDAVNKMKNGCILNGGVGTGKSRTGLYYYFKENGGSFIDQSFVPMKKPPQDLYIITTAMKRDSCEWDSEISNYRMSTNSELNTLYPGQSIVVDSWNTNSLMLRLAIRVRFADAGLAKEYAEKAVKHPAGLIDSKELAAQMGKGAGLQMKNPLKVINEEYNDTRMGATIYSYLAGYNDARAAVYFVKNNGFKAVRCGIAKSGDAYNGFTRPNVHEDDPLYWMKASEVCFLKAEGALAGFDMGGSAGDFYNAGIRMSFSENGLDNSSAETYLKDSTRKPANYTDTSNGELSANAPSSITIRWENGATEEEKLERIITQKYLAIFPNGQEAWTEWRRTGYPRQIVVAENKTNSAVLIGNGYDLGGVRRLPYPRTEYEQNGENLHNAISQYLGGVDNAATKVWWDKKSK